MKKSIEWEIFQKHCDKKQPIGNPSDGYTNYCSLICISIENIDEIMKSPGQGKCFKSDCPVYK